MRIFYSMFMKLISSRLWRGLASGLFALTVTAYADLFALNAVWTRLLVFACGFAAWWVFTYGAGRLFKSAPKAKTALLAAAAAALILALLQGVLFPRAAREVLITLVSETAGEICFCDLVIDGRERPVGEADVVENAGWQYREQYDNFVIQPEEDGVDNHLTMRFFAEEVRVGFPYTPYAGSVTIQSSAGSRETLDLRCPEWGEGEKVRYADVPIDCRRTYPPPAIIGFNAGFFLFLSFIFLVLRCAAGLAWGETPAAAPDASPEPAVFNGSAARDHRPPHPKRDYSSLPLWLAAALAAVLFVILYWYSAARPYHFPEPQDAPPELSESAPLRENKDIYQQDANLYDVYISVFPTEDEDGNTLDFSAFALHTGGDHSYNPVLDCNIQILPEGQTPDPQLDLNQKNATIRVRGNTSRGAPYKDYKVRLDLGKGSFFGQTVLNINKDYYDITKVATKLSTDLLADLDDVTGYRSYFMRLWIRDASLPRKTQEFEYQGLYVEFEPPNKAYFRVRGLSEPAALYKARGFSFYHNGSLRDVDDPEYSQEAFEHNLGIMEGGASHQNLLEMLEAVGDASRNFEEVFTEYFDEDNYLTWLAFNLLMGNEDIKTQNYLIYNPEGSRTWFFIHWDFNSSLLYGKYASNVPESLRGVQELMVSQLHRRYFQEIPGGIEKLDAKMRELLDSHITKERVTALVNAYKPALERAVTLGTAPDLQNYPLEQRFEYLDNLYDGILHNYDMFKSSSQYPFSAYVHKPLRQADGSVRFGWNPFYSYQGRSVTYTIRVYGDLQKSSLLFEKSGITETEFLLEDGLADGTYYLEVLAVDSQGHEQVSLEHYIDSEHDIFGLLKFTLE